MIKIIDLHCDTISKIQESNPIVGLYKNEYCIDVIKLQKAGSVAQFFAIFIGKINDEVEGNIDYEYGVNLIKRLKEEVARNNEVLKIATTYKELIKNSSEEKISVIMTIENCGIIKGDIQKLENLYNLGIRLITLVWNYPNCLGYPNSNYQYAGDGITDFGGLTVERMNELGIIIDVSHLSDQGVKDVINISNSPIVASHSNAREIWNHPRNLSDELIKKIASSGGIIGVNFYNEFLGHSKIATVKDIALHVKHIKNVGGIESVAIGSDFDGFKGKSEIENISQMYKLIDELKKYGFSSCEIEKIFSNNVLRVLRDVEKN